MGREGGGQGDREGLSGEGRWGQGGGGGGCQRYGFCLLSVEGAKWFMMRHASLGDNVGRLLVLAEHWSIVSVLCMQLVIHAFFMSGAHFGY